MRVNASEALVAVPGLVIQNRQNYAQDLQISSRGFGARSQFGVRGVRLIADGIPATMPDGQGQAATFNLDMAERIEVLRGPFSVVYGNHSGGVVQLFTREGRGQPVLESTVSGGSDGMWKVDLNATGRDRGPRLRCRCLPLRYRGLPCAQRGAARPGLRQAEHETRCDEQTDDHRQQPEPARYPGSAGRDLGHLRARSACRRNRRHRHPDTEAHAG
jgi:hypothetical protein